MRTVIMGQYEGGEPEEIDEADGGDNTAEYLLAEYRMAYGAGWRLWVAKKREEDD